MDLIKPKEGRVYCSSDWHGCGDTAIHVLDALEPNDKLFYLGDAIDRGPYGVQLMKQLLDDERVVYLLGNHEEMMREALRYGLVHGFDDDFYYENENWLYNNGGMKTFESLQLSKDVSRLYVKLKDLPSKAVYCNINNNKIIMEHAGYTPDIEGNPIYFRRHDPVWDREHFSDDWRGAEDTYLIHGHTPVQYLKFYYGYNGRPQITKEDIKMKHKWDSADSKYTPEIIRYCDGHKIDIDLCTIASNRIALFDLDTFEVRYFNTEGEC